MLKKVHSVVYILQCCRWQ